MQVALVAALCVWAIPRLMGRDYDAVVMAGGFCGFMLGTTANAMANMGALVERYGPAPKAYLVVPLVGAFGIDFVNGLLITATINLGGRWGPVDPRPGTLGMTVLMTRPFPQPRGARRSPTPAGG